MATSSMSAEAEDSVEHWRNKCNELENVVKTLSSHCFKGKLMFVSIIVAVVICLLQSVILVKQATLCGFTPTFSLYSVCVRHHRFKSVQCVCPASPL